MNINTKSEALRQGLEQIIQNSADRDKVFIDAINTISSTAITTLSPTCKVRDLLRVIKWQLKPETFYIAVAQVLTVAKDIYADAHTYQLVPRMFLSEESFSFGFVPLDQILEDITKNLDKEIFPEADDILSWFMWDNEFGKQKLTCWKEKGGDEFVIASIDDMVEFLTKY